MTPFSVMQKQDSTKKPLVSVIMPVYNTKDFVWEAIESILNQTFKEFEFIIVDDWSTDWSYEICEEYAKKDNRIKLYKNDKNRGIWYTKNRLIELSTTNYIATQDSDDISTQNRLNLEYKFLDWHKDYAIVAWNNIIIDEEWKQIGHRKYSDDIRSVILKQSPVSHPTTMLRKDIFEKVWWYSHDSYVEDYDLWIRFYVKWYKIKNIDKDLLKYRIRKWAHKNNAKRTIKETIKLQEKAYKSITPTFSDKLYHIALRILTLLPNTRIIALFKLVTY